METQVIESCLFVDPRNDWERKELHILGDMYKYVYKDPRSVEVFCRLIYFYREEIAKRKLLNNEFGEEQK